MHAQGSDRHVGRDRLMPESLVACATNRKKNAKERERESVGQVKKFVVILLLR